MPYRYIENIATADAAFKAWGTTAEELFISAAEALINVMVTDLKTIDNQIIIPIHLESETMEMLLYELLQEIIFQKDVGPFLLKVFELEIDHVETNLQLRGMLKGEKLDSNKHDLIVDVKAVTFHQYRVEETETGWEAVVVVDI